MVSLRSLLFGTSRSFVSTEAKKKVGRSERRKGNETGVKRG